MALDFDGILKKYVGTFGKYQKKRLAFFSILCGFLTTQSSMSSVFMAARPEFHCEPSIDQFHKNCTEAELTENWIPKDGDQKFSQCEIFSKNTSELEDRETCSLFSKNVSSNRTVEKCTRWKYNKDLYESTVVTEWDLVCDKSYLATNTAGFYMAARSVGILLGGYVADRYIFCPWNPWCYWASLFQTLGDFSKTCSEMPWCEASRDL